MKDLQSFKSSPAARCTALRQKPIMSTSYAIGMGTLHFYWLIDYLFDYRFIMESVIIFNFVVPNKVKLSQTTSANSLMHFWEQTTKQPSDEEVHRAALKSLHQLAMDGFRRTATYPSNGWVGNQPLQFLLGFCSVSLLFFCKIMQTTLLYVPYKGPWLMCSLRDCSKEEGGRRDSWWRTLSDDDVDDDNDDDDEEEN